MHKAGTLVDPAPDFENWAGDVTCLHGGLQPDEKRRKAVGPAVRISWVSRHSLDFS